MFTVLDSPRKTAFVYLRRAVSLLAIYSSVTPLFEITTWTFALTNPVPNLVSTRYATQIWWREGSKEAIWTSIYYPAVVMGLTMMHKNGLNWSNWLVVDEHNLSEEAR